MKNIFYYVTFFCFIFGVSYMSSSKIDYKAYKYAIKKQMLNNQTETLSKKDFYSNLNERTGHVIHMVNDRTERIIHMEGRPDCPDGYVEDCSGDGDCCSETWIGDGYADCGDQAFGCDLTCYDCDGGDCDDSDDCNDTSTTTTTTTTSGGYECPDGYVEDCADDDCCQEYSSG